MNAALDTPAKPTKPLGQKAYGSIPHLPGSRRGSADKGLDVQQARILTERARDKHDRIIVQEKLDGSNVAVAKLNGQIVPLMRAGYEATASKYEQHRFFAKWAFENFARFDALLREGERCVGEWLMEAHGTRYDLPHEPFVIFDIMRGHGKTPQEMAGHERTIASEVVTRCANCGFTTPRVIHAGDPISIADVLDELEPSGHGALDPVEGAVWRVERHGIVDFLGKYVRPEKVDGKYLSDVSGSGAIYNWRPMK